MWKRVEDRDHGVGGWFGAGVRQGDAAGASA